MLPQAMPGSCLRTVILPKRNEPDLDDLPDEVRNEMTFVPVETIEEALPHALPGLADKAKRVVRKRAHAPAQNGVVKEKIAQVV